MQYSVISTENELEFPKENRLIYDWVSLTTKVHKPEEIMQLIGMSDVPWEILNGGNGYQWRHYFMGISISFSEDMTNVGGFYLLEMSGQGCRTFETYGNGNYNALFALVRSHQDKEWKQRDVRLTRLDVAFDDMTCVFDMDKICDAVRLENIVARSNTYDARYSTDGKSVNVGSRGSNTFIRIYDKAMERGYTDGRHWVRCELQLRVQNAGMFARQLEDHSLQDLYRGVLKNYLSFRIPNEFDSNKRRWEEEPWWTAFLDDAVPVSVYEKPGVIYNLSACEKYVATQPVGSIKTLIEIYGVDGFIRFIAECPPPKNPKYRRLIAEAATDERQKAQIRRDIETAGEWHDLTDPEELEMIYEIHDGYREVRRMHDVKRQELLRDQFMQRIRSRMT